MTREDFLPLLHHRWETGIPTPLTAADLVLSLRLWRLREAVAELHPYQRELLAFFHAKSRSQQQTLCEWFVRTRGYPQPSHR